MITKFIIALMLFFNFNTKPVHPNKPGYNKPDTEISKPNRGEGEKAVITDDINP